MPGRLYFICPSITHDVRHPFPSACTKMYARHECDSRGARHAWLSWPRAKVSDQVHQRHLSTAPHRRPPAITRGDSDSNGDDHVNYDEDTAASPSGTGALYKKNVSPLSSLSPRWERRGKREWQNARAEKLARGNIKNVLWNMVDRRWQGRRWHPPSTLPPYVSVTSNKPHGCMSSPRSKRFLHIRI